MIVDMYAGAGGVSQGLRMAGRTDVVGIDVDRLACTIATLAGHEQGFPLDYPWPIRDRSAVALRIANAVPPPMYAALVRPLL